MGRGALALLILVVVAVALGVGYYLYYGARSPGEVVKPEVRSITSSWGEVTSDTTEVVTSIVVYNQNPFPIPVKNVAFDLYLNDVKIASGSSTNISLPAKTESTIVLRSLIDNRKMPEAVASHISQHEVSTVKITGSIVFDLKAFEFTYPFQLSSRLETNLLAGLNTNEPRDISAGPVELTLKSLESTWGTVSPSVVEVNHKAVIYNHQVVPIPVTRLDYEIYVNNIKIGEGTTYNPVILKARADTVLPFTTRIDMTKLGNWWVSHLKSNETTHLVVKIYSVIEFSNKEYRFELYSIESDIHTNILGR